MSHNIRSKCHIRGIKRINVSPRHKMKKSFQKSLMKKHWALKWHSPLRWGVVCSSAAGEGWRRKFRVWCQGRLTSTADLHHLIMPRVFEQDDLTRALCWRRGKWKAAQVEKWRNADNNYEDDKCSSSFPTLLVQKSDRVHWITWMGTALGDILVRIFLLTKKWFNK